MSLAPLVISGLGFGRGRMFPRNSHGTNYTLFPTVVLGHGAASSFTTIMSNVGAESSSSSRCPSVPEHPFAHTTSMLEIIPDKIDVEEESRLYDDLCNVRP